MSGGEDALDWGALVPRVIYPTKLWIIEAIRWIDQPLSATQLRHVFDREFSLSSVSYHVTTLAEWGVLEIVETRQGPGSIEKFYAFIDAIKA